MIMELLLFKLQSENNAREHWRKRAGRRRTQRAWVRNALSTFRERPSIPCRVILTRNAPRKFDDDNLAGAFKAVRDEIASWLCVDDASPLVQYSYRWEKCPRGLDSVTIEFLPAPVGECASCGAKVDGEGRAV